MADCCCFGQEEILRLMSFWTERNLEIAVILDRKKLRLLSFWTKKFWDCCHFGQKEILRLLSFWTGRNFEIAVIFGQEETLRLLSFWTGRNFEKCCYFGQKEILRLLFLWTGNLEILAKTQGSPVNVSEKICGDSPALFGHRRLDLHYTSHQIMT